MAWVIELDRAAERELDKLDPQTVRRILTFLFERIAQLENPRSIGEALTSAKLGNPWRYRVGDYRLISSIEDSRLLVLIVKVGHRREIYQ